MQVALSELSSIKARIISKVQKEIDMANKNDELELILEKYGITLEEERLPINTRTYRILVVGALAGSIKDYQSASKKVGINPDHIEFIDYDSFKKFDVVKLEYSNEYSDIILGPVPHKVEGMGDTRSFASLVEREPLKYPRAIRANANSLEHQLKLSISTFKECLTKTFYYESLLQELA